MENGSFFVAERNDCMNCLKYSTPLSINPNIKWKSIALKYYNYV